MTEKSPMAGGSALRE
ncbi:Protein of unknown function [Pyronema omphalodes CBS 100304]|uniref:Uncharacterized protein n=1 Tax=Pyronema omphalodes (strain CBS 100304) TaxID=1076935 RepID=U4LS11_PYROM|nr:Protein of unknown function [Pyronema omphalodes CBS 100304]